MSTYRVLIDRIADETTRSDLSDQIKREIISAIKFYERRRFAWSETTSLLTLTASVEYYGVNQLSDIPLMAEIDSIRLTVSGTIYPMIERDFSYIEEVQSIETGSGDPTDFCRYKEQLRFYPIPNATRVATIAYMKREVTLSADADTNAWTTEAEELIRARAKANLCTNVIRDLDMAAVAKGQESEALAALEQDTITRISSGRVKPVSP